MSAYKWTPKPGFQYAFFKPLYVASSIVAEGSLQMGAKLNVYLFPTLLIKNQSFFLSAFL